MADNRTPPAPLRPPDFAGDPGGLRDYNRRRVLQEIRHSAPVSRVHLARATGLSQPTVSAIVTDLIEQDVVFESGMEQGGMGRPRMLLGFNRNSGCVIGFDIGGTRTRAVLADLEGNFVAHREELTTQARGSAVVDQVTRLTGELLSESPGGERLLALGIGTPGVFEPESGRIRLAPNIAGLEDVQFSEQVAEQLGVPVQLENDVNMAALGEQWRGVAQQSRAFAVVAIGTGIGVGIVLDGEVWRGEHGAAGEIAYVPIPRPYELAEAPEGSLERHVGTRGVRELVERALEQLDDDSVLRQRDLEAFDVREVFALALEGDPVAMRACDEHGHSVALALLMISSLLDPELIVLAGGLGTSEYVLDRVRAELPRYVPIPPTVMTSGLGDQAQLYGAVSVALRLGLSQLETSLSTNRRQPS